MSDVERVARAICRAKGVDPDYCVQGSGSISSTGIAINTCHRRAWQDEAVSAQAAIDELSAASSNVVSLAKPVAAQHNDMLVARIKGVPASAASEHGAADPCNPNTAALSKGPTP